MKSLELMRLQMEISILWMYVKEQQFVDVCADPFEQLEEITAAFTDLNADYLHLRKLHFGNESDAV